MTITVRTTIEIPVEVECEISGRYRAAVTHRAPENCSPAEYPEVEIVSIRSEGGAVLHVADELSRAEVEAIEEMAQEQAAEWEADAREAAAEDAAEARRERMRDEDY